MSETVQVPTDTPQVLLEHHLEALRLPTFLREYDKVARQCAAEDVDYPRYLLRMSELELLDRERRATERRVPLQPDFRIACTGTPVENRLVDMWNIIDTVQPRLLGSAKEFSQAYEQQENHAFASLKARLLYQQPNAFLLRRSKAEVLELPQKHEHKLICSMSEPEVGKHMSLVDGLSGTKATKGKLDLLHRFARLYQHPQLLDGDGDGCSVLELKAQSSKLREVLSLLYKIQDSIGRREGDYNLPGLKTCSAYWREF